MRCYHLNNFYLGGIHAGIQSAHAQHELMLKYVDPTAIIVKTPFHGLQAENYLEWAREHKTIIVLNAGMQAQLKEWTEFLCRQSHSYAWAPFYEEEDALNGALTNVALVLPARIYQQAREITNGFNKPRRSDGSTVLVDQPDRKLVLFFDGVGDYRLVRHELDASDCLSQVAEQWKYNTYDIQLMARLSKCGLM